MNTKSIKLGIIATSLFALSFGQSSESNAAAFFLQEQSVASMGYAYSGAVTEAPDASTIFFNPAGLTQLPGAQIQLAGTYIYPRSNNKNLGSTIFGTPIAGVDSDNPIDAAVIPNLYASAQMNEMVWIGIGVTAPFGMSVKYDDNWYGRYDSIKTDLKTINISPVVAIKVTDKFSIGGGMDIQTVDVKLTSAGSTGPAAHFTSILKGSTHSVGFNFGLTYDVLPTTTIGMHHRSNITHKIENGKIGRVGQPLSNGSADFELPSITSIGISHDLNNQWSLHASSSYFEWSEFQTITPKVNGAIPAGSEVLQKYNNSFNVALGAAYEWNAQNTIRFGYQFDKSPVPDSHRTTRTPDGDRQWLTAGWTHDYNQNWTTDISAGAIKLDNEKVDVMRNGNQARVFVQRDDSWIGLLGLAVTYKF